MIVLDTNVLSEVMRIKPDSRVMDWLNSQASDELFLAAISVAEILYGIARLPDGKRKESLREMALTTFKEDFDGRILAFDETTATHYADLVADRECNGRPISMADAQIAAICVTHGATLATRNTRDFVALGLSLIDPWRAVR